MPTCKGCGVLFYYTSVDGLCVDCEPTSLMARGPKTKTIRIPVRINHLGDYMIAAEYSIGEVSGYLPLVEALTGIPRVLDGETTVIIEAEIPLPEDPSPKTVKGVVTDGKD